MAHDFCKMDRIAERTIQYLHKKGLAPKAIHADMVATLCKNASSYATIKMWLAELKHGKESLKDDPHSGRPVTMATHKIFYYTH